MPKILTVIDANRFWSAPEDEIFPLPVVAVALGVGRNRMHLIPVASIKIEKRKCYRKSDILDWALSDAGKSLLQELRSKNSSIGRAIKARSAAMDRYYNITYESLRSQREQRWADARKTPPRVKSLAKQEAVIKLARLSDLEYRKVRESEAKLLKARTATLDMAVDRAKALYI